MSSARIPIHFYIWLGVDSIETERGVNQYIGPRSQNMVLKPTYTHVLNRDNLFAIFAVFLNWGHYGKVEAQ